MIEAVTPPILSASDWEDFLSRELNLRVTVEFNQARSIVIQWKRLRRDEVSLRMNQFFNAAPQEIQQAVSTWLRSGRRAKKAVKALDIWIDQELRRLGPKPVKRHKIQSRGNVHNLEQISSTLWDMHFVEAFRDRPRPKITWGSKGQALRRQRHLRLGSYNQHAHLIRVHRSLDQEFVPEWFVRYILFHELLHAELGIQRSGSRRVIHGPEFRRRERQYEDYNRAIAWEKKHIAKLLKKPSAQKTSKRSWIQKLLFG